MMWTYKFEYEVSTSVIHGSVHVCSGELLLNVSARKSTCNVPFVCIQNLKVKTNGKSIRETKPFFLISYKFCSIHLHSDIWGVSLWMRAETRVAYIFPYDDL